MGFCYNSHVHNIDAQVELCSQTPVVQPRVLSYNYALAERWIARLRDGTPLVTSRKFGEGRIVLFHVTANAKWSNLPLSGLFVNMLRRIATLGSLGGGTPAATGVTTTDSAAARRDGGLADPQLGRILGVKVEK